MRPSRGAACEDRQRDQTEIPGQQFQPEDDDHRKAHWKDQRADKRDVGLKRAVQRQAGRKGKQRARQTFRGSEGPGLDVLLSRRRDPPSLARSRAASNCHSWWLSSRCRLNGGRGEQRLIRPPGTRSGHRPLESQDGEQRHITPCARTGPSNCRAWHRFIFPERSLSFAPAPIRRVFLSAHGELRGAILKSLRHSQNTSCPALASIAALRHRHGPLSVDTRSPPCSPAARRGPLGGVASLPCEFRPGEPTADAWRYVRWCPTQLEGSTSWKRSRAAMSWPSAPWLGQRWQRRPEPPVSAIPTSRPKVRSTRNPAASPILARRTQSWTASFHHAQSPPATDIGDMPLFWASFNNSSKRIQDGGWARQVTQADFADLRGDLRGEHAARPGRHPGDALALWPPSGRS